MGITLALAVGLVFGFVLGRIDGPPNDNDPGMRFA